MRFYRHDQYPLKTKIFLNPWPPLDIFLGRNGGTSAATVLEKAPGYGPQSLSTPLGCFSLSSGGDRAPPSAVRAPLRFRARRKVGLTKALLVLFQGGVDLVGCIISNMLFLLLCRVGSILSVWTPPTWTMQHAEWNLSIAWSSTFFMQELLLVPRASYGLKNQTGKWIWELLQ